MNDHEAITQIDIAMQAFYVGVHDSVGVLNRISFILGANSFEHQKAKEVNP